MSNVLDFHKSLKEHNEWIVQTSHDLKKFKYPSKIVETVLKQINEHSVSRHHHDYERAPLHLFSPLHLSPPYTCLPLLTPVLPPLGLPE